MTTATRLVVVLGSSKSEIEAESTKKANTATTSNESSQKQMQEKQLNCQTSQSLSVSPDSHLNEGSWLAPRQEHSRATTDIQQQEEESEAAEQAYQISRQQPTQLYTRISSAFARNSQQVLALATSAALATLGAVQQQQRCIYTQANLSLCSKQKQTQFSMSSLAVEPAAMTSTSTGSISNGNLNGSLEHNGSVGITANGHENNNSNHSADCSSAPNAAAAAAAGTTAGGNKLCFNTGLPEIIQFMELIGNLKHTKRTGWVLRNVNDCESISGHMYRMSMMTFLLDGTEGLNPIRCMELALVHDLAESLVGDITPFCGISREDKRAMEFKAMDDICQLIQPRGKRIMELFEEYEQGESPESKFVKDLDRLDMVMQAFEYEKRDNCLLQHQEFFDSTEGKFNHPFVKKLVNEIYEQRKVLANAKGAKPPAALELPNNISASANCASAAAAATASCHALPATQEQNSSSSS